MKYIEKIESFPIFVTNDYLEETKEFKDTKGAIDIRKSKKDSTHNGRKRTKGQTSISKTLHRKLKIKQHEFIKTGGELMGSGRVTSFCSTSGTRRVTLVKIQ